MIAKATLRYIRISPRKVRPVIALIKGKKAEDAIATLFSVKKKASALLIDVISSALSNAKRMPGVDVSELYVSNLIANGGPQLKRFRAASMGRAGEIRKRTSHITVELDTIANKAGASKTAAAVENKNVKTAVKGKSKEAHVAKKAKVKEPAKAEHTKKGKE